MLYQNRQVVFAPNFAIVGPVSRQTQTVRLSALRVLTRLRSVRARRPVQGVWATALRPHSSDIPPKDAGVSFGFGVKPYFGTQWNVFVVTFTGEETSDGRASPSLDVDGSVILVSRDLGADDFESEVIC